WLGQMPKRGRQLGQCRIDFGDTVSGSGPFICAPLNAIQGGERADMSRVPLQGSGHQDAGIKEYSHWPRRPRVSGATLLEFASSRHSSMTRFTVSAPMRSPLPVEKTSALPLRTRPAVCLAGVRVTANP